MKKTMSETEFINDMQSIRPDNFTIDGLMALFGYFEEFEPNAEFDPVGICCSFIEYESLEAFQQDYDEDEFQSMEDIRDRTTVIDVNTAGSFIVCEF
jgi:hypothetical protein